MHLLKLLLLLFPAATLAQDRFLVTFEDGLDVIRVTACFDGSPPQELYHSNQAAFYSEPIHAGEKRIRLDSNQTSTRLPALPRDACMDWSVDLTRSGRQGDPRKLVRAGGDLIMDTDLWFWRGSSRRKVSIEVEVPVGLNVSAPWPLKYRQDNRFFFVPGATPATWTSRFAVGSFDVQAIQLAGTTARLAITGSLPGGTQKKLSEWISSAANAVGNIYGTYPQASPQILIVPVGPRNGPVPWAHVMRGGGVSAEFFVDETSTIDELTADWTACHELAHMLLPFVSSRDRWLSEGLASYYQYVLLARSGKLSEQQAWQGLHDGFGRGKADQGGGTLQEATAEGWKYTMRIYWSGAAIMLLADIQLRAESKGVQSLDTALASLQSCCLDSTRRWRAKELFRQLDRLTGTGVFTSLYTEHVESREFPDLSGAWKSLGVQMQFNHIRLLNDTDLANIRSAIMAP